MVTVQYPIGKVQFVEYSEKEKEARLADILFLPKMLEYAVLNLNEAQLQTPYREGGWTVNQLVHHVADSHMNAFIRCKLALTEENPTIKPYDQDAWVSREDVSQVPVNISITLLHALHHRWYELLKSLTEQEWKRTVYHPEQQREISIWNILLIYAWHGKHHAAHVTNLREEKGWN
ncbi:MAG: putative metal-dependent hydrolase [Chitinophagia bacterium]|jgi:DinB superfamily|nr:putative metal-dependent hydrolase [Chitinophagia bacterium]